MTEHNPEGKGLRIKALARITKLKQIASHRSMALRAKLSKEFIQKLINFITPQNITVNKCIENIKEELDDNSCQKC